MQPTGSVTPSKQERINRAKARARICAYIIIFTFLATLIGAALYGAYLAKNKYITPPTPWYKKPEFLAGVAVLVLAGLAFRFCYKKGRGKK